MPKRRKCEGGCGRWLKSPAAVELGYDRVCAERLGIPPVRPARTRRPAVRPAARPVDAAPEPIPGQVALELQPMQPSPWSL